MKRSALLLLAFLISIANFAHGSATPSVASILQDASYIFNRYDELVSGVNCSGWRANDSLKASCAKLISTIGDNVSGAKESLAHIQHQQQPSTLQLFDIYAELNEVGGHLSDLSNNVVDFAGQDGVPFAEVSSKAFVLAAHLGNVIRERIVADELQNCAARH